MNADSTPEMPEPNPGSQEAVESGCTCPIMDNHHGEGIPYHGKREWWIASDCPLHSSTTL